MTGDRRLGELAAWAAANPTDARLRLARPEAERSLWRFVELMWPVLEPGTPLVGGWALRVMCEHLEAVADGRIRRLAVAVPPGMMKSKLFNVFFPAWMWGPRNKPHLKFFGSSYSEVLSLRDNGYTLTLIQSPRYQALWGDRVQVDPRKSGERKFALLGMGHKIASSLSGVGTGERGDVVILDDLLSAGEVASEAALEGCLQYFTEVVPTRVNDERSAIILIMQRLHERDPIGHVLSNDLQWDRLILPMEHEPDHPYPSRTALGFVDPRTEPGELLFPERFSREFLEKDTKPMLRSWGGEYAISSQLQQRPSPRGGGLFKREHLKRILSHEVPPGEDVRGWDLAGSKDGRAAFTVGARMRRATVDGRAAYYVTDIVRGRWTPGEVRRKILETAVEDGRGVTQDFPQDPGQAGLAQKSDIAGLLEGFSFTFSTETGSKEDRARPLAAQAEVGNLYLVQARWVDQLAAEMTTFPAGAYKDQVDALSRAFSRLVRRRRQSVGGVPVLVRPEPYE